MPLKEFNQDETQSGWATWHIDEDEAQLTSSIIGGVPDEITSGKKRLEWLAGRQLILTLCNHLGLRFFGIRKDEFGKPFWRNTLTTFHSPLFSLCSCAD